MKTWLNMKRGARKKGRKESARSYREELAKEKVEVDSLITYWTRGGHGHMDLKKDDRIFRILLENYNSLQIMTDSTVLQKMRSLNEHHKRYKADLRAGCETQTNWYHTKFQMGKDSRILWVLVNTQDAKLPIISTKRPDVNLVELLLQPLDKHLDMI